MIERRDYKLSAWHWKAAAKFWRHRAKKIEKDKLGWMRLELRAYTCLSLIASSGNWTIEDLITMAKQGMKNEK